MDCLFCKIASKKLASFTVWEDEHSLAFLDIHPRAPGHIMVIPKYHAGKLADLPDEEVISLFKAVKRVTKMLEVTLVPQGLTIGINQGAASGQEIDHLHVHLLPRFLNDRGGSIQSVVNNAPQETVEEIAEKIKKQSNRS